MFDDGNEEGEGEELTHEDVDAMRGPELKELVKEWEITVPKGAKINDVRQLLKDAIDGVGEEDADDDDPFGEEEEGDNLPF